MGWMVRKRRFSIIFSKKKSNLLYFCTLSLIYNQFHFFSVSLKLTEEEIIFENLKKNGFFHLDIEIKHLKNYFKTLMNKNNQLLYWIFHVNGFKTYNEFSTCFSFLFHIFYFEYFVEILYVWWKKNYENINHVVFLSL